MIRRVLFVCLLAVGFVPLASAQDHLEVGAFADYFHLSQTNTNFGGLGARVGFGVYSHVKLEGEMSYDFDQAFNEGFTDTGTGSSVQSQPLTVTSIGRTSTPCRFASCTNVEMG